MHDRTQASRRRAGDVAALLAIFAIAFFVVGWSGNLTSGPHYVDEAQIFTLKHQFERDGFWSTSFDHLHERLTSTKRLVPVFIVQKLVLIEVLGGNLFAWHTYTLLLGVLSAWILYAAARWVGLTAIESFGFAAVAAVGPQSVVWWRLIHGEGIGMLFTALAMLCIPAALDSKVRGRYQILFVTFVVLASLSKESFILLMPALVGGKIAVERYMRSGGWLPALRENGGVAALLGAVCTTELATIRFYYQKTDFAYTGWKGFDADRLMAATQEFFAPTRGWMVLAAVGIAVGSYAWSRRKGPLGPVGATWAIAGAIVVPQVLLYMSSGFSGQTADLARYLLPGTLALSLLAIAPAVWARVSSGSAGIQLVTGGVLIVYVGLQGWTAFTEARRHAAPAMESKKLLERAEVHAEAGETVVVVGGHLHGATKPYRTAAILRGYLGIENVRCLPVTDDARQAGFLFAHFAPREYVREKRADYVAKSGRGIGAVVITDKSRGLESAFLSQESDWFDPAEYERYENARGEVAYLKGRER